MAKAVADPQVARVAGTGWTVVLTPGAAGRSAECRHQDGRTVAIAGWPWGASSRALLAALRALRDGGERRAAG